MGVATTYDSYLTIVKVIAKAVRVRVKLSFLQTCRKIAKGIHIPPALPLHSGRTYDKEPGAKYTYIPEEGEVWSVKSVTISTTKLLQVKFPCRLTLTSS